MLRTLVSGKQKRTPDALVGVHDERVVPAHEPIDLPTIDAPAEVHKKEDDELQLVRHEPVVDGENLLVQNAQNVDCRKSFSHAKAHLAWSHKEFDPGPCSSWRSG